MSVFGTFHVLILIFLKTNNFVYSEINRDEGVVLPHFAQ